MTKKGLTVKALATGAVEIILHGVIGSWGLSARDVIEVLSQNKGKDVYAYIQSPGGNMFEGVAIYHAFKRHAGRVITSIDGAAASAASVAFLGGHERRMPENTFLMIHNPWNGIEGDAAKMREMADTLEKFEDMLVSLYESETGLAADDLRTMMQETTWFTANESLEKGFATHVDSAVEVAALASDFSAYCSAELPESISGKVVKPELPQINSLKELEQHLRDVGGYSNGAAKALVASAKQIIARDATGDGEAQQAINLLKTFKIGE